MLPNTVTVTEVGPRDGLQNERQVVSTEHKVELVNRLTEAGFKHIEVSSFVSPKWIPMLADAAEVFQRINRKPGVVYSALVPNERGLERALLAEVDAVNVFMSASETHNRKNINKGIDETFSVLQPVIQGAKQALRPVRGYVSTVFGCPYEGPVDVFQVVRICETLLSLGVDEISLGDTIGVAVPGQVLSVMKALAGRVQTSQIALHFHDTRGMAIANIYAGLTMGVEKFDSSVGGLGGCPYAPGASGNVATEDVLYLLHQMGVDTGIQVERVTDTALWLESVLEKPVGSRAVAVARSCTQPEAGGAV